VFSLPDVPIRLLSHVSIRECRLYQPADPLVASRDCYNVCKKSFHGIQKFIQYYDYCAPRLDNIQEKKWYNIWILFLKINLLTHVQHIYQYPICDLQSISTFKLTKNFVPMEGEPLMSSVNDLWLRILQYKASHTNNHLSLFWGIRHCKWFRFMQDDTSTSL